MNDSETIKKYLDILLGIVNKVRLLGTNFSDCRIVEKILVTVLERYEASITTLENTKYMSKITLVEKELIKCKDLIRLLIGQINFI